MLRLVQLGLTLLLATVCLAQMNQPKRLILKDGSYQSVTKWEVKGDRVRYLSAERFEWEEIPNSLVDWAATNKWEKDRASGTLSPEGAAADAEEKAEREAEAARHPQIAPGLNLREEGVFLLDTYNNQQQLVEIVQNGADLKKNMKGNILRATINPIASARQTVEIKGLHALVQSHVSQPSLFINVDTGEQSQSDQGKNADSPPVRDPSQRFRLIKAQPRKDARVVSTLKIAITGHTKQEEQFIPAQVQALSGGWYKITPSSPLAAGEYAVAEMLSDKDMNLYVWDFGVNPSAPANPTAWKPAPVQDNKTGTNDSPVLKSPKK